jgi:hypothetical protein
MMYYQMFFDPHREGGEMILDVPRYRGEAVGDHTRFIKPGNLSMEGPLYVSIDEPGEAVDMHMPMNIWVVTPAVGEVVERVAGAREVQRIACKTDNGRAMEVIHTLLHLECLDLMRCKGVKYMDERQVRFEQKHSVIKPRPPFVSYIQEIAIDPVKAQGHHFFRIAGYEIVTVVSEEIKLALQSRGTTGVSFLPLH